MAKLLFAFGGHHATWTHTCSNHLLVTTKAAFSCSFFYHRKHKQKFHLFWVRLSSIRSELSASQTKTDHTLLDYYLKGVSHQQEGVNSTYFNTNTALSNENQRPLFADNEHEKTILSSHSWWSFELQPCPWISYVVWCIFLSTCTSCTWPLYCPTAPGICGATGSVVLPILAAACAWAIAFAAKSFFGQDWLADDEDDEAVVWGSVAAPLEPPTEELGPLWLVALGEQNVVGRSE